MKPITALLGTGLALAALVGATHDGPHTAAATRSHFSDDGRATAVIEGRDYCIPEDIVSNVLPVCAHRIISKTAMHDGDTMTTRRIMQQVLETVPSPA